MRKSGILMPIFSLPSKQSIGTFGRSAYEFIDFLKLAGQKVWQILPLCPIDHTNSPYQSVSCFAGNPLFIDFYMLYEDKLLLKEELVPFCDDASKVCYSKAKEQSDDILHRAFGRFNAADFEPLYSDFLKKNEFWLFDYAIFLCAKEKCGGKPWCDFPPPLANRDAAALAQFKADFKSDINYHIFVQFIFSKQWSRLKNYADQNGITIFGDMPIYTAYDSADVWAHKECFLLNTDKRPEFVAGTPPDAFSKEGQLWGSPLYDFNYLKTCKKPYYWWVERLRHALYMYDIVRIDHFRAFDEFFAIPAGDKTAENGVWMKGCGKEFFDIVKKEICDKPSVVAEDLGVITDSVRELLKYTGFAGMRVLQFAFDGNPDNPYLPYNFNKNTVAYIGTHDNETLTEFAKNHPMQAEMLKKYIGETSESLNWATIRLLEGSTADTVILTLQDIMGTGGDTRINTPGAICSNWEWRIDASCLNSWLAGIINEYTKPYGR